MSVLIIGLWIAGILGFVRLCTAALEGDEDRGDFEG